MSAIRAEGEVRANEPEGGTSHRLRVFVPGWPDSQPGQFVMLQTGGRVVRHDPLLPRPMALYRTRPSGAGREIEILYKVVGRGTGLLAELRPGDPLRVVGPLGCGFPTEDGDDGVRRVLIGGGTGIASLFELAGAAGAACVASLENTMACGFGVCLGCAVPRSDEGFDLVCRDGPVFDSRGLRWEGLP